MARFYISLENKLKKYGLSQTKYYALRKQLRVIGYTDEDAKHILFSYSAQKKVDYLMAHHSTLITYLSPQELAKICQKSLMVLEHVITNSLILETGQFNKNYFLQHPFDIRFKTLEFAEKIVGYKELLASLNLDLKALLKLLDFQDSIILTQLSLIYSRILEAQIDPDELNNFMGYIKFVEIAPYIILGNMHQIPPLLEKILGLLEDILENISSPQDLENISDSEDLLDTSHSPKPQLPPLSLLMIILKEQKRLQREESARQLEKSLMQKGSAPSSLRI